MDADLDYWRERVWQAASTAGLSLTDEQLESMAVDMVAAATTGPDSDHALAAARRGFLRTEP